MSGADAWHFLRFSQLLHVAMAAAKGATPNLEVLEALLACDNARLSEALAGATPQQLVVTYPLSLYHAAALWSDCESVRLLHAAGVPAAAADAVCHGAAAADLFQMEGDVAEQVSQFQCTPLAAAVWRGDAALVDALLEAGAAVDQPSPQLPGVLAPRAGRWDTEHQPATPTPLDIAACCSAELGEQHTMELLQLLLAAGADVTRMNLRSLFSCGRGPARLLMQRLQQASEEGQVPMSAEDEDSWYPLVRAAAECDSVPALEHFLGRVLQLPVRGNTLATAMPRALLRRAAEHGSLSMLRLAAQGAAQLATGGAAEEGSMVARVYGPHFAACLSQLLESASQQDQAPTVCLLLDLGAVPTAAPFRKAVEAGAMAAVCTLLSRGLPSFEEALPQPLQLPTNPRSMAYPCPILATLQTRLKRATFTRSGVEAVMYFKQNADAVHPWDAKLLPGLEALLDAGCRPRTFTDVLVSAHPGSPAQLRKQFDPLDPSDGDAGLDVKDLRLLALAIEHPEWSPASHRRFPRSFRTAVPTLLLVAHCGGTCGTAAAEAEGAVGSEQQVPADGAVGLAALPADLLHRIIGLAAYPLSALAPLDAAATQAVFDANGWGPLPL